MDSWWKVTKLVLTDITTTASLSRVGFFISGADEDDDPIDAAPDDAGAESYELGEHIDLQVDDNDVLGIGDIVKLTVERLARL